MHNELMRSSHNGFFSCSRPLFFLLNISHLQILEVSFSYPHLSPLGWLVWVLSLYFVIQTLALYLITPYLGVPEV